MRTQSQKKQNEAEAEFLDAVLGFMPYLKDLNQRGKQWYGVFKNGMRFRSSDSLLTQLVQQGK